MQDAIMINLKVAHSSNSNKFLTLILNSNIPKHAFAELKGGTKFVDYPFHA